MITLEDVARQRMAIAVSVGTPKSQISISTMIQIFTQIIPWQVPKIIAVTRMIHRRRPLAEKEEGCGVTRLLLVWNTNIATFQPAVSAMIKQKHVIYIYIYI